MRPRQLQLLFADSLPKVDIYLGGAGIPFNQAANLLGQEFSCIYFDATVGFNLEAFAIAAGTLKAGGTLYLRLNPWERLPLWQDHDSLRWSGEPEAIATPAFIQHLQKTFASINWQQTLNLPEEDSFSLSAQPLQATNDQEKLLQQILTQASDIYLLTAKRGRGKSVLAGLLAKNLTAPLYVTAANKNAAQKLQDIAANKLCFIAPDELSAQLETMPLAFTDAWLFVDEAAMIPLPQLLKWSTHFQHILLITTVQGYEGTGRGFALKLQQLLQQKGKTVSALTLDAPLRWAKDDPLEQFVDRLLLLQSEDNLPQMPFSADQAIAIQEVSQAQLADSPEAFYGLLTMAHYRTSPIDLRRLFDAPKQRFFCLTTKDHILGALWGIEEGKIQDTELLTQLTQGYRRPKGNLVPQALSLQYANTQIAQLHSLRISRIALQPQWQNHGLGSRLLEYLKAHYEGDFLSVSFGYTTQLAHFWQKNGFTLVHLGHHQDASSGAFNAIAICGINTAGKALEKILGESFGRYLALSFHPLRQDFSAVEDWSLQQQDWQYLTHFAYHHYPLAAIVPSLRRLLEQQGQEALPQTARYLATKNLPTPFKNALKSLRLEIANYLEGENAKRT